MVMVEVDSNAILVEPIKSQASNVLQRAYLVLLDHGKAVGIVPKKHILNNECSEDTKQLIRETCRLKLVQPYCHRCNAAEVVIKKNQSPFHLHPSKRGQRFSHTPLGQAAPAGGAHYQSAVTG